VRDGGAASNITIDEKKAGSVVQFNLPLELLG
jgi:hypothetical protein